MQALRPKGGEVVLSSTVASVISSPPAPDYADIFDTYFRWAACLETPSIAPISDQLR